MRYSGEWMVLLDDRILEHLEGVETTTAKELSEQDFIVRSRQQVSNRLNKLAEHGLVKDLGNGVYRITERGERYLAGEIDTSENAPDEVESAVDDGPSASGNHEQA
ncbi:MarR family transcriptional regulator [Halomicroarcula salina]|uniref:MarR family transcriptional regulator n=2 Tax=Haloarcula salina TaxID=1429914 RepID=A0AA41FZW4_9EURY|nr:MarR family transcriptional regulator [Haloarcula salina]